MRNPVVRIEVWIFSIFEASSPPVKIITIELGSKKAGCLPSYDDGDKVHKDSSSPSDPGLDGIANTEISLNTFNKDFNIWYNSIFLKPDGQGNVHGGDHGKASSDHGDHEDWGEEPQMWIIKKTEGSENKFVQLGPR